MDGRWEPLGLPTRERGLGGGEIEPIRCDGIGLGMKITVLWARNGKDAVPGGLDVKDGGTVEDLMKAMEQKSREGGIAARRKVKLQPTRQRFSLPPKQGEKRGEPLKNGKKLSDYGIKAGSVLHFKDLGPQIGYATVFFWEYFGPLAVYPLFYFLPEYIYSQWTPQVTKHPAQTYALVYWSIHYAKRILETFFVHQFSHGTMPIFNLFKNCTYYWGFAAFVSYFINHPLYTPVSPLKMYLGFGLGALCQVSNLYCHLILASLRARGSKEYLIPKGFLFNICTCANYTAEIYGWLGFNIATQSVAGYLFMFAGAYQMTLWAIAKHKRLRRLYDGKDGRDKYPKRFIVIPPFI